MSPTIERAAMSATAEDVAAKLRNAPEWVRRGLPGPRARTIPASSKPTARAKAPVIGWLAGVLCPALSRPCLCSVDNEKLPEQMTPNAMRGILDQVRNVKGDGVTLTLEHYGPTLARSGDLDLTFSLDPSVGLQFEARLRDTPECRKLLDRASESGFGISMGFTSPKTWIVERDNVGRVRVIDGATLHHVAVVEGDHRRSIYPGARCFAVRSTGWGCPESIRKQASVWAFRAVRLAAGAV
jgi:hypothetical protein